MYCAVRGALVEVNTKLVTSNPEKKQQTEAEEEKREGGGGGGGGGEPVKAEGDVTSNNNDKLDPLLLCDKAGGEGFIAIIKPAYQDQKKCCSKYISYEQYITKKGS